MADFISDDDFDKIPDAEEVVSEEAFSAMPDTDLDIISDDDFDALPEPPEPTKPEPTTSTLEAAVKMAEKKLENE